MVKLIAGAALALALTCGGASASGAQDEAALAMASQDLCLAPIFSEREVVERIQLAALVDGQPFSDAFVMVSVLSSYLVQDAKETRRAHIICTAARRIRAGDLNL